MGTLVSDIFAALETRITTVLPTYAKLKRIYDLENNDFRTFKSGYALRHGDQSRALGTTRMLQKDHSYEIVLTNQLIDRINDNDVQTRINSLYGDMEDIEADLVLSKAGIPDKISLIDFVDTPQPTFLAENNAVALITTINVKFRKLL